ASEPSSQTPPRIGTTSATDQVTGGAGGGSTTATRAGTAGASGSRGAAGSSFAWGGSVTRFSSARSPSLLKTGAADTVAGANPGTTGVSTTPGRPGRSPLASVTGATGGDSSGGSQGSDSENSGGVTSLTRTSSQRQWTRAGRRGQKRPTSTATSARAAAQTALARPICRSTDMTIPLKQSQPAPAPPAWAPQFHGLRIPWRSVPEAHRPRVRHRPCPLLVPSGGPPTRFFQRAAGSFQTRIPKSSPATYCPFSRPPPPDERRRPSEYMLTDQTQSRWSRSRTRSAPLDRSQIRRVPS